MILEGSLDWANLWNFPVLMCYEINNILYKQCERIEARQNAFGVKLQQLDATLFILVFKAKCATE